MSIKYILFYWIYYQKYLFPTLIDKIILDTTNIIFTNLVTFKTSSVSTQAVVRLSVTDGQTDRLPQLSVTVSLLLVRFMAMHPVIHDVRASTDA